jgi:cytochrome P450
MMNAGSDTTAIAMTNFLYIIMKHPHIMAKLRSEIDEALKDEDPNIDVVPYAKVRNIPYLRACIDESLRLWPPTGVGLPRETPKGGTTILGQHIPGGLQSRSLSSRPIEILKPGIIQMSSSQNGG